MELTGLLAGNFLSPALLFFYLGIISGLLKSNLEVPDQISRYFSIYLMMSIGFKGGVAIAEADDVNGVLALTILSGIGAGFLQPYLGYFLLRKTTRIDSITAAALAAHYGSISVVTFVTAINFLEVNHISYAGYIVAVLSMMEAPAIVSGLLIAHHVKPKSTERAARSILYIIKEIITSGSILLLLGSFLIGFLSGTKGMQEMQGFLIYPFQGILALFLLDMGLLVAKHFSDFRHFNIGLFLFGIYMPIIGCIIGCALSIIIGLDMGTGFLFTVLVSSSSYIVVTATMRTALPEAKAAIYLPMSLAVTFPFNITIGIPLYFSIVEYFLAQRI